MKVKRAKEILKNLDDDAEIFIKNSYNPLGNIGELCQIEKTTYGFMGKSLPCVVLNTFYTKDELVTDEDDEIIDFIEK